MADLRVRLAAKGGRHRARPGRCDACTSCTGSAGKTDLAMSGNVISGHCFCEPRGAALALSERRTHVADVAALWSDAL